MHKLVQLYVSPLHNSSFFKIVFLGCLPAKPFAYVILALRRFFTQLVPKKYLRRRSVL